MLARAVFTAQLRVLHLLTFFKGKQILSFIFLTEKSKTYVYKKKKKASIRMSSIWRDSRHGMGKRNGDSPVKEL